MQIFHTPKGFKYFHPQSNRMISTSHEIPFIVNWDGKLEEVINEYLLLKTELDWTGDSRTPINNATCISSYLEYCYSNNLDWKNASDVDIRKYISYLTEKGLKGSTIKNAITIINSLYNWSFSNSKITDNPFLHLNTREVSRVINVFSNKTKHKTFDVKKVTSTIIKDISKEDIPLKSEVKDLYNILPEEDQLMCLLLLESGMRKEELLQFTYGMFKSMRESSTGKSYFLHLDARTIQIKYNKSREVIVSQHLRAQIARHLLSDEYKRKRYKFLIKNPSLSEYDAPVFISNRGNKFSPDKLNKSFHKACIENGYNEKHGSSISPHQLRHYFASHFISKKEAENANMEQAYIYLAERLGHSSPDVTKAYYVRLVSKIKENEDLERYSEDFIQDLISSNE